jgi:cytochrome c-type biogenesis protein CcmH
MTAGLSRLGVLAVAGLLVAASPAGAVEPGEALKDPGLEARARRISAELRCVVCQNQSIDDSNAPLARDLRLLVRERLTAGDSDKAVLGYVVERYGEFVLLRPPLGAHTIVLWLAPALLLAAAAALLWRMSWSSTAVQRASPAALSDEEQRRLAMLLTADGKSSGTEKGSGGGGAG